MKRREFKFFLVAIIVFFLNSAGLPYGLLYTTLLTPFFYIWVVRKTGSEPILPFLLLLTPFIIAHMVVGVDLPTYLISFLNITCIYIFCCAFYLFLRSGTDIGSIFKRLLFINFFLCLIAIPFYFTPLYNLFWIEQDLTEGVTNFRRLRMFTYEASYYSTLMVPLIFFFISQLMLRLNKLPVPQILLLLLLPMFMSFSLGVISAIIFALGMTYFVWFKTLTKKKRVFGFAIAGITVCMAAGFLLFILFPDNTLFIRIAKVLSGHDSSAKGRTFEAFLLADKINSLKSQFFGIGFGQVKKIGAETIRNFYQYGEDYAITIPNATAETIAILGWMGFTLRLLTEIFLFFYTKVYANYYRLFLFFFIFLYQFTGSFITNVAEYIIWVIAFTNVFPQFDVFPRPPSDRWRPSDLGARPISAARPEETLVIADLA
jgi:hypothetical protein